MILSIRYWLQPILNIKPITKVLISFTCPFAKARNYNKITLNGLAGLMIQFLLKLDSKLNYVPGVKLSI